MSSTLYPRLLVSLVLATAAMAQSSPQVTLTTTGGRLGDYASVQVTGIPLAAGILGIDTAAGPTMTSFGLVQLGLTPQLQLLPFNFGAGGSFAAGGIPPAIASMNGLTLYLQAACANPTPPNPSQPFLFSNAAHATLTSPKLVIIDPGNASSPWTPCAFCIYDALTDLPVSPAILLPSHVLQAISIPSLGLVAIMVNDYTVRVYDVNAAALVSTIALPPGGPGETVKIVSDGIKLYALWRGAMPVWGTGIPGTVRSYALPSGAPLLTMPLPAGVGNPDDLLLVPGSNIAYLRMQAPSTLASPAPGRVLPIDLTTGATLPVINFGSGYGGILAWTLLNGMVYCLMPGAYIYAPGPQPNGALSAFSTTTNAPAFGAPVVFTLATGMVGLRAGPGTNGAASLFLTSPALTIYEVSPVTLNPVSAIPLTETLVDMRVSGGGTEWLLLTTAGFGAPTHLATLSGPLLAQTPIATLPGSADYYVAPLSSQTVRKAYVSQTAGSISPFTTDPSTPPTTSVPLPVPVTGYIVLSN